MPRLTSFSRFFPPFSTALCSSCPSHAQPIPSFPHSSQVTEDFCRTFRRVWSCFQPKSTRGAVTVPVNKDRNVEKTRTLTLSVKGRAPGAVPNEGEIVIPDGSFFPLNLDPLGGEPASPSDSEQGPYLHLFSFIIFLPHHHRHHPSFSKRWARFRAALEIVNAVPRTPPSRVTGLSSLGLVLSSQTPNLGHPY